MAVERIAAGEGIREIAEEIGANKSLVSIGLLHRMWRLRPIDFRLAPRGAGQS